ncbi:MAG: hypothetical protein HOC71_14960 [Candidatus Latescibacteria bacterium]|jgi:hypothetical protein|nr:hypothetical protein [Candidatus Latescibacterota bacterium]
MIKSENNKSLLFGAPGIFIQLAGSQFLHNELIIFIGTILFVAGVVFYARSKGRHPLWGILGAWSFIGVIIIALLKDKSVCNESS